MSRKKGKSVAPTRWVAHGSGCAAQCERRRRKKADARFAVTWDISEFLRAEF